MRISVERMPEDVDNSLIDVNTYLNTTDRQINSLFKDNYELLASTLNYILDRKLPTFINWYLNQTDDSKKNILKIKWWI